MTFLIWTILGLTTGWLLSLITGKTSAQKIGTNISMGIIGAILGGLLYQTSTLESAIQIFSFLGFLSASAGILILLGLFKTAQYT